MFCPNCGTQQADTAAFCGVCGRKLQPVALEKKVDRLIILTFLLTLLLLAVSIYLPLNSNFFLIPMVKATLQQPVAAEIVQPLLDFAEENKWGFSLLEMKRSCEEFLEASEVSERDAGEQVVAVTVTLVDAFLGSSIMTVILGFLPPMLLTLLAGLCKNKVLTMVAMVLLLLYQFLMCGYFWMALTLAVYLSQFFLCQKAEQFKQRAPFTPC